MPRNYDIITEDYLMNFIVDAYNKYAVYYGEQWVTLNEVFVTCTDYLQGYFIENDSVLKKDLAKVGFDFENYCIRDEGSSRDNLGIRTLGDFVFLQCCAGGDWEIPVMFIMYISKNRLRCFIPDDGNLYNTVQKMAYGNNPNDGNWPPDCDEYNCRCHHSTSRLLDAKFDLNRIDRCIIKRFGITI